MCGEHDVVVTMKEDIIQMRMRRTIAAIYIRIKKIKEKVAANKSRQTDMWGVLPLWSGSGCGRISQI